jgi:hypothetical protein
LIVELTYISTEIGKKAYFQSEKIVAPYDLKSYGIDKELEISNRCLIRDIAGIIKLKEILFIGSKN